MRLWLFVLGVLAATLFIAYPTQAQEYPWCAYYNFFHGGATNCGFATYQQCVATVRGVGGSCGANPRYQPRRGPYLFDSLPRRYRY